MAIESEMVGEPFTDDMYECRALVDPANNQWAVIPCADLSLWPVNMTVPRFVVSLKAFEAALKGRKQA